MARGARWLGWDPLPLPAGVVEEYAERWVIIDRLDTDRQPVEYRTAYALAGAAFDGVKYEDIEEIFEQTAILDGRHVIEPGRVYAWRAVV